MSKWDYLIETDEQTRQLRRRALETGADTDWDAYENYLIRQGELPRALDRLAERASLSRMDLVRRLLDKASGLPKGKVVMLTGMLSAWMGETPQLSQPPRGHARRRESYLVLTVSGNSLRVRMLRHHSPSYTRWSQAYLFPAKEVSDVRFYIADLGPGHLPDDYYD